METISRLEVFSSVRHRDESTFVTVHASSRVERTSHNKVDAAIFVHGEGESESVESRGLMITDIYATRSKASRF